MKRLICFAFLTILLGNFSLHAEEIPVKILIPQVYFSPNQDGNQDSMEFFLSPRKGLEIIDWEFTITDESGKLVRMYQADTRHKVQSSFLGLFRSSSKLVGRDVVLPRKIEWNGFGANGKIPPDGRYLYRLKLTLPDGSNWTSTERTIYLDSHAPMVKNISENRTFNPYIDKSKELFGVFQEVIGENSDRWKGTVYNLEGLAIRTFIWEHSKVPKFLTWDGKDDRGILQDPGFYRYEIQGEDFSGNKELKEVGYLEIQNRGPSVGVHALYDGFSPNGDGWEETMVFRFFSNNGKGAKNWKFSICKGEWSEKTIVKIFSGEDNLPAYLEWDGLDSNGKKLSSGEYSYALEIENNGNSIKTIPKKIQMDLNPIQLKFQINTNKFTPDNDGENDVLEISPKIQNVKFLYWKLSLVEKFGKEIPAKRRVIKRWKGYGNPSPKIYWDGLSDEGRMVGSMADLEMHFSFRNNRGEFKTFQVKEFSTGILVSPKDKKQLKISIPEYILQKDEDAILSLVKSNLRKYPGYKVEVQSHSKQLGDNKENMRKTEKRSKEIFQKLFGQVATTDQFSYRGFGEIDLLFQEEIPYYQEKNDRVDLILTLPENKK